MQPDQSQRSIVASQRRLLETVSCKTDILDSQAVPGLSFLVAGSGAPIVLLHGANIGWAQWYRQISAFAGVGQRTAHYNV